MTGDINMTGNSVVKFYDPIAARARAKNLTDQMVKGSVYNDADAMVVKSETGPVALKGTDVSLSNGEGGEIAISGVTEIRRKKNDPNSGAVKLNDDLINLAADTVLVGQNGSMQGEISMGTLNLYDDAGAAVLKRHNSHLDINVPDAQGSVYINRNQTEGGTGELHLTEIHAPNDLRLNPGTNVNVLSKRITGLSNGTANTDAVNLSQLNGVKTIAQNAQSAAESAGAKADQALEKAESVVNNTPQQTGTIKTVRGETITCGLSMTASSGKITNLKTEFYVAYGYLLCHVTANVSTDSPQMSVTFTTDKPVYGLSYSTNANTDSSRPITNGYTFTFYGSRNIDFLIMIGTTCNTNLAPMF